jgi:hypothetical protein
MGSHAAPVKISESVTPLSAHEERPLEAHWRAANFLSVGESFFNEAAELIVIATHESAASGGPPSVR